ncbi:MAG: Glu-tRNA(Gln) amidotransferase subunit GatD [Candidatus Thermoplasmatota archaeon]
MKKKNILDDKLHAAEVENGDTIRIKKGEEVYEGVLMPHHIFSSDNIITIKLKNGYNIGLEVNEDTVITLLHKSKKKEKKEKNIPFDPAKPTVSIIGTGGTIASYVDYRTGAVHPATSAEDLAFSVPEIFNISNVKAHVAFQLFSEDISPAEWLKLAEKVAYELNHGAHGVVIPHGTDTLGYTSALSFLLKNLSGPVVLVGAQRSSDRPSTDAVLNLQAAVRVAATTDLGEVVVVMHGESSDTYNLIHRGTKIRKNHTSRRDAFKTINDKPLGRVEDNKVIITEPYKKKSKGPTILDNKIEEDVGIIYASPSLRSEDIPERKGLVLMGTGLGHVPNRLIPRLEELIKKGTVIVMTSQCINGRVNLNVYSTGRDLLKIGVIPGENMLPETACVKLMWALAHGKNREEITELMRTNIAGEISPRSRWTI